MTIPYFDSSNFLRYSAPMSKRSYSFDYEPFREAIVAILTDLSKEKNLTEKRYKQIVYRPVAGLDGPISKAVLLQAYTHLVNHEPDVVPADPTLADKIKMKPMRTQSGVTPVTILTKPFPCPGKFIFCPNDVRMPKSYLPDEPGAQRATRNHFDPYLQTYDRLRAFEKIGHSTSKIELIILGGTWSYYPESYQRWFIKRSFEALNDFSAGVDRTGEVDYHGLDEEKLSQVDAIGHVIRNNIPGEVTYNHLIKQINAENNEKNAAVEQAEWSALYAEHAKNVMSECRCVGLVIETRPDIIDEAEAIRLRKLGCTKIQIGIQSLQDEVLALNKRGHDVARTKEAFRLLRLMGFKIHGHWMANLYGSTPEADKAEYGQLFWDEALCPDELKIYPCSLLETAELMDYWRDGRWVPYTEEELVEVVASAIVQTPEYCRLTRVIRDIPSTDIVTGNKKTNLREIAEKRADNLGQTRRDIRSREIKNEKVTFEELVLDVVEYQTTVAREYFLQYVRKSDHKICAFLRLSLPISTLSGGNHPFCSELDGCAMIREVHVYGNVVDVGKSELGRSQHLGLGSLLIQKAKEMTQNAGYQKLAVISAIGTRDYYAKRGFELNQLYQTCDLSRG